MPVDAVFILGLNIANVEFSVTACWFLGSWFVFICFNF